MPQLAGGCSLFTQSQGASCLDPLDSSAMWTPSDDNRKSRVSEWRYVSAFKVSAGKPVSLQLLHIYQKLRNYILGLGSIHNPGGSLQESSNTQPVSAMYASLSRFDIYGSSDVGGACGDIPCASLCEGDAGSGEVDDRGNDPGKGFTYCGGGGGGGGGGGSKWRRCSL